MNNDTFNNLLLNMLNDKCELKNDNICLITNEKLKGDKVTLFCNHSFNYESILNEIIKQKQYNSLETQKLQNFQIKCPYCRNVQNKLLPYNDSFPKLMGVNYPLEHTMFVKKCKYVFLSGKSKNCVCNIPSHGDYCPRHLKIINKRKEREEKKKKSKQINQSKNKIKKEIKKQNNYEIKLLNGNNCNHFLLKGKNKGNQCSKKHMKNSKYCSVHAKYYCKKTKQINELGTEGKLAKKTKQTFTSAFNDKKINTIKMNKKITI